MRAPDRGGTVLAVSYYFPPLGGMGSVRAARFAERLPRHGWQPIVVTPREGMYHRPEEGWQSPGGIEVVRTASLELSRVARGAYRAAMRGEAPQSAHVEPLHAGRVGGWLRQLLREFAYVPDAQIGWLPFALRASAQVVERHRPRVVYTSSVPYTSHLVGRALKRRYGIPWVAEFRDLWTGSQAGGAGTWIRRAVDARLEDELVREATAVVVTTAESASGLVEAVPALDPAKVNVIPNAYDASAHPPRRSPGPDRPFTLVSAGTLIAGLQDPAPLLAAAHAVDRDRPGSIRITVLGPPGVWESALARVGAPPHLLDLRGVIAPGAVPEALSLASCVLILVPGQAFDRVLLGKTMEWLGSGVPALAVVSPDGAMGRLLARAGGNLLVPRNDPDLLADALVTLLDEHRAGRLHSWGPDPAVAAEFEVDGVTARLAAVLERSAGEGGAGA